MKNGLKAVSVIFVICGALAILLGLFILLGIGSDFLDPKNVHTEDALIISGLISMVTGMLQIGVGICGFSGCNGHFSSLNAGIMISVISIIISIVNAMKGYAMGNITANNLIQYTIQTILPILYIIFADNLKPQICEAAAKVQAKNKSEK